MSPEPLSSFPTLLQSAALNPNGSFKALRAQVVPLLLALERAAEVAPDQTMCLRGFADGRPLTAEQLGSLGVELGQIIKGKAHQFLHPRLLAEVRVKVETGAKVIGIELPAGIYPYSAEGVALTLLAYGHYVARTIREACFSLAAFNGERRHLAVSGYRSGFLPTVAFLLKEYRRRLAVENSQLRGYEWAHCPDQELRDRISEQEAMARLMAIYRTMEVEPVPELVVETKAPKPSPKPRAPKSEPLKPGMWVRHPLPAEGLELVERINGRALQCLEWREEESSRRQKLRAAVQKLVQRIYDSSIFSFQSVVGGQMDASRILRRYLERTEKKDFFGWLINQFQAQSEDGNLVAAFRQKT